MSISLFCCLLMETIENLELSLVATLCFYWSFLCGTESLYACPCWAIRSHFHVVYFKNENRKEFSVECVTHRWSSYSQVPFSLSLQPHLRGPVSQRHLREEAQAFRVNSPHPHPPYGACLSCVHVLLIMCTWVWYGDQQLMVSKSPGHSVCQSGFSSQASPWEVQFKVGKTTFGSWFQRFQARSTGTIVSECTVRQYSMGYGCVGQCCSPHGSLFGEGEEEGGSEDKVNLP